MAPPPPDALTADLRRVHDGNVAGPVPRRSLILAGGGMRVAWQAGAVLALEQAGVAFAHVDGTSGGIMNAAMVLSGLTGAQMCQRWSTLDVRHFTSLLRVTDYLKGPTNLVSVGDADGITDKVFPHLGIDVEAVRACHHPEGSFNVCNFNTKTVEAIPHDQVDLDLLVAGMSLPIFMPPVVKDGVTWTDAVWIKDANLLEAVRRGSRELWLLWCIGNTAAYGAGPFEQYVHMIEMSANGAVIGELGQIADHNRARPAPVVVHVVKPEYPLPLDPDLYLGRITASTLVAMGYRDARAYLSAMGAAGVALDHTATQMREPPLGIRFRERCRGELAGQGVELDLTVEVRDLRAFAADPSKGQAVAGTLVRAGQATAYLYDGSFAVTAPGPETTLITYTARFDDGGRPVRLVARTRLHDDPGLDLWPDLTTVELTVQEDGGREQTGTARLSLADVRRLVASIEPTGAHDLGDRARAVATVGRVLLGTLWDRFA